MIRAIRWIPIGYYAFALVWAILASTIEFDELLQYVGILGGSFYLALASEWGTEYWTRGRS